MDIIYTSWAYGLHNCSALFKEWTGRDIAVVYPEINVLGVVAKDKENDRIVGAAQLTIIDDAIWGRRWGLVENVYVAEDCRRQGVGRGLMKEVEDKAYSFGCAYIKLTSGHDKKEAHALYRSIGYTEGLSFKKQVRGVVEGRPLFQKRIKDLMERLSPKGQMHALQK